MTESEDLECDFCGETYIPDLIFEDYCFDKQVCTECISQKEINLELRNLNLKYSN